MVKPSIKEQVTAPDANHQEALPRSVASPSRSGPVHTLIALRAHRKWLERGCQPNTALQD